MRAIEGGKRSRGSYGVVDTVREKTGERSFKMAERTKRCED